MSTEKKEEHIKHAEEIIADLLFVDEVSNNRQSLTTMFYDWITTEIDYDQESRIETLSHYKTLLAFLNSAEQYNAWQRRERNNQKTN